MHCLSHKRLGSGPEVTNGNYWTRLSDGYATEEVQCWKGWGWNGGLGGRRKGGGGFRLILNGYRRALCGAGRCCSFISFQWKRLSCVYLTLHCYFARSRTREKETGIIEPYIELRISLLSKPSRSFFHPSRSLSF